MKNTVVVRTLENCLTDRNDGEMDNVVDTVEYEIQNKILTAIDNTMTPRVELAASSGREATSVIANSERGEHIGITASFEIVSSKNKSFHESSVNDETRGNIPDEISKVSVLRIHLG